jgi:hypothetical protein
MLMLPRPLKKGADCFQGRSLGSGGNDERLILEDGDTVIGGDKKHGKETQQPKNYALRVLPSEGFYE